MKAEDKPSVSVYSFIINLKIFEEKYDEYLDKDYDPNDKPPDYLEILKIIKNK